MIYLRRLCGIPINKLIDEDDIPLLQKQVKAFLSLDTQNRKTILMKIFKKDKNDVIDIDNLCSLINLLDVNPRT
jgi:hypothetical protein